MKVKALTEKLGNLHKVMQVGCQSWFEPTGSRAQYLTTVYCITFLFSVLSKKWVRMSAENNKG
jgi:hypothetical protein